MRGRSELLTLGLLSVLAIEGTWRGQSTCVQEASACKNETVVYYIKEVKDQPDRVRIQADKIVNGQAITMGAASEWRYDPAKNTVEWTTPRQTWLLNVKGNHMDGTLTLTDGTLFRKVTLEKD